MSEEVKATTRAKFSCFQEVVRTNQYGNDGKRTYEFQAVYDDGTPENERYSKYTPYGKLEIAVDNPAVVFKPGKLYYLDFTEAD